MFNGAFSLCLLGILILTGCQHSRCFHHDIAKRRATTVVVFGRTFFRYYGIESRMPLETLLTAAAIIGFIVALLQLLIWAFVLLRACIRYIRRTYHPLLWASGLIHACRRYIRKRPQSYTTTRKDLEMAIIKPSNRITGLSATHADYVHDMAARTCQISGQKGRIRTNSDESGVATRRSDKNIPPTNAGISATGVHDSVMPRFRLVRRKRGACDLCYDEHERVDFAGLRT